jgi:hypothetical protein
MIFFNQQSAIPKINSQQFPNSQSTIINQQSSIQTIPGSFSMIMSTSLLRKLMLEIAN